MRTEVHITADIQCTGIEVRAAGNPSGQLEDAFPAELGLSEKLVRDVGSWQKWFDGVVELVGLENRHNVLGDQFDETGLQLAERVAAELGAEVSVFYSPQGGWCRTLGPGRLLIVR